MPIDSTGLVRKLVADCSADAMKAREATEAAVHQAFQTTAIRLADQYAISDIESNATPQSDADGVTWYDVAPMVNPDEVSSEFIDMASELLAYALARRLFEAHHQFPNLWRKVASL